MSKTVRQLSEELHLTKQAIYSRMDAIEGFRENYTTKTGNRIMIDEDGEDKIIKFDYKDKYQQTYNQKDQTEHQTTGDAKKELDLLIEQLSVKDDQIKELQQALNRQQQLQLASLSKVKELEAKLETKDREQPTKVNKKWWHFWD